MTIDQQLLEEVARLEARVEELENENATLRLKNDNLESQGLLRRNFWREARTDITSAVEQRSQAEQDAREYRTALEEVYNDFREQSADSETLDRIRTRMDAVEERRNRRGPRE